MMAADPNLDPVNYLIGIWHFGLRLCLIAAIALTVWQVFSRRKSWWTFGDRSGGRADDLQALSAKLGFDSFNPGRDDGFVMGWSFLNHLSRGDDRYAFNILQGKYHDARLFIFDYHYQLGSDDNKQICYGTMLMLVVREVFPQVTITPENLRDKLVAAIGAGDEIQFESAEFSRKYCVRSKDKKIAYDVCNPQMMEYLLANPGLEVEVQGPVISLAFEPQLSVAMIELNLQRLAQIRSLLPEYLFTKEPA